MRTHLTYQRRSLQRFLPKKEGRLILKLASHLDAFSVYLFDTLLPCYAAGATTGPQEVSPLRSSRTRSSSSQSSYGHDR